MLATFRNGVTVGVAALALGVAVPAFSMHGGAGLQWVDGPANLPKGAKLAILEGDPGKAGPFVLRLAVPAGYTVPPHSHPQVENVTVIKGTVLLGMGDKLNKKNAKSIGAGEFIAVPANANHFAIMKTDTVLQVHGEGPFDTKYVNPADDRSRR